MQAQNKENVVEDGSVSQYNPNERSYLQAARGTVRDEDDRSRARSLSGIPSRGDGQPPRQQDPNPHMDIPTPDARQVLVDQDEEIIFRSPEQKYGICYDDASPVMHPERRSTLNYNGVADQTNVNSGLYLKNPVTPMTKVEIPHESDLVSELPQEPIKTYYMSGGPFDAVAGAGGGGGSSGSSSTSTSHHSDRNGGDDEGRRSDDQMPNGSGPPDGPPNRDGGGDQNPPPVCAICGGSHETRNCPRSTGNGRGPRCTSCDTYSHTSSQCPRRVPVSNQERLILSRNMKLRNRALQEHEFTGRKSWNKYLRTDLSSEDRIAFDKAAAGYVLSKHNKLRVTQVTTEDKEILTNLLNTHNQLRALKAHVIEYDIGDVFTVLLPVGTTGALHEKTFDLFTDYPKCPPGLVAMSNRYYNSWVDETFIAENLNLTYTLIKNNTDEVLFQQALEDYDKYKPISQGGPLLLSIILHKINAVNAQYQEFLWIRVKALEIRKTPGENVDTVVSLLNAAYTTFRAVSTDEEGMNKVPPDWSKQVLQILQTSSVEKFNRIFANEEELAYRAAANAVGMPVWPTHASLMTWATNQYRRFKQANAWDIPKSILHKGYLTQTSGPGTVRDLSKIDCFNCGKKGHLVNDCKLPKNEATIKKNLEKFRKHKAKAKKAHVAATDTSTSDVKEKKIDGLMYKMSKDGVWTLSDPKKMQERAEKGKAKRAAKAAASNSTSSSTSTPQANVARAPAPATNTSEDWHESTQGSRNNSEYFTQYL